MSKTVSGELITIDDSAYDGFKGMTVYGNTVQNLWVNPSGTSDGITVTSNDNGSITLSGSAISDIPYVAVNSYVLRPNTSYTLSIDKAFSENMRVGCRINDAFTGFSLTTGQTSMTFTTPATLTTVEMGVLAVAAGVTVSGTYRIMLNEGSEPEPWCPPGLNSVGDDGSVKIVTAGKNLFLKTSIDQSKYNITAPNALVPGVEYSVSISVGGRFGVGKGSSPDHNIGSYVPVGESTTFVATLEDALFDDMIVTLPAAAESIDSINIQLELGSTATDYEQPNITTTVIDLQDHKLNALPDGTRDELHIDGGGNVVLEKRCGDRVVDGTSLAVKSLENSDKKEARINVGDSCYGSSAGYDTSNQILSDKLPSYDPDILWRDKPRNGCASSVSRQIAARCNDMSSISAFNQFFQQNNMHVIYKLVEPQTIDLGKINLPKLRKKPLVNNVFANGSAETTNFYLDTEMELTYRQWPGVRADGFKVSGKHNFWDFASCVASSDSGKPEKKFVTATVPYMSGFYDLSKIYGAIAYESRDVSYTFELLGDDMEDLQRQKTNLLDWLGLVHDEPIYDDTQPNYHYVGSFYEADWEEDETGESGTLTVTFKCQPFLIADRATEESLSVGTHTVVNNGQQVSVFAKANSGSATVKINGVIQAVTTTEQRLTAQLQPGENEVVVTSNSVTLRYYERHL